MNTPDVTKKSADVNASAPVSGSETTIRTVHMSVSISGVLRWPDKDLVNMFTDNDGNRQPASLVRDFLKLELLKGRKVLPMGEPCEGWSYETGCPGHPSSKSLNDPSSATGA